MNQPNRNNADSTPRKGPLTMTRTRNVAWATVAVATLGIILLVIGQVTDLPGLRQAGPVLSVAAAAIAVGVAWTLPLHRAQRRARVLASIAVPLLAVGLALRLTGAL